VGVLVAAIVGSTVATGVGAIANAAPPSPFTVVEGSIRSATGTPSPPSGTHATLWGNRSSASTTIEGAGRVVVGATGTYCAGWPRLQVMVDGVVVGTAKMVDARRYGAYPIGRAVGPGRHQVTIRYTNDFRTATCDRNVHIASARMERPAEVAPAADQPVPPPVRPAPTTRPAAPTTSAPATTTSPRATTPPVSTPPATTPPTSRPAPPAPVEIPDPPVVPGPAEDPDAGPAGGPTSAPGPADTGTRDGATLRRHDGDMTVTTAGAVVEGLDIHGFLRIQTDGVTVRNTRVRGGDPGDRPRALIEADRPHRDLVVEDSTLRADTASPYLYGIWGHNFTARRLDVSNVVDNAMILGDNVTIAASWFHGTTRFTPWALQPDNQTHNDNVQIEAGRNILIEGNNFEGASNAAIMITQNVGTATDIRVIGNRLSGGDCTVNISEKGRGPIGSTFIGNVFGASGIPNCAVVARDSSQPVMRDNTWEGTVQQIEVRSRPT
jgi:hypothetical protein